MKTITDYSRFENILPYASEIFGVYQPLIGWKSKRKLNWIEKGSRIQRNALLANLSKYYRGIADIRFDENHQAEMVRLEPGETAVARLLPQNDSVLLQELAAALANEPPPRGEEWERVINRDAVRQLLQEKVFPRYREETLREVVRVISTAQPAPGESQEQFQSRIKQTEAAVKSRASQRLERESAVAGALLDLVRRQSFKPLQDLFFLHADVDFEKKIAEVSAALDTSFEDPYLTFDPKKDVKDVTVSPLGIVHLFRQYFFEFDTFLGTPTGHVWLSPGSTVELIEVNTRKEITERTIETTIESLVRSERGTTDQDEISEAVKQDNRDDSKLGISSTVNQSWPSGSASATASLNMDRTQQTAREQTHKRMRQQTEKLSSEIRQNFKTTFKTITEVTDTSSKRYVLSNTTPLLINYELRRKMRQVGVQVQDIGTYLCWETFVDEPGQALGLANLVHLAQPADLTPQPSQKQIPRPPDIVKPFQTNATWNFGKNRKYNDPVLGFVELTVIPLPVQPDPGYQVAFPPDGIVDITVISYAGEDAENQRYLFRGKLIGGNQIRIGVITGPDGIEWSDRIDFVVGGAIKFAPTPAKLKEIDDANAEIVKKAQDIDRENARKQREAFIKAAKERIKFASKIKARKFEELREEERTIVYRNLIRALMSEQNYKLPESKANFETRHVLSELINSIFDVDKMLYFVAPEWWKPRDHRHQFIGAQQAAHLGAEAVVNWSDNQPRPDNYFITEESEPARLGSSLGWLLQLDGDNLRNAFLNAPWVKAVIPVRPGKEQAAINWLQNVKVEGADGLDAAYAASAAELNQIRNDLLEADPADPVAGHPQVTIGDAVRFLCLQVSKKHADSLRVERYPKGAEIHDDNKVSATPIEKVYEHGFYPLKGGFRVNPVTPDPNNPDRYFQVFDQWVEVLPTDQVVPVEVKYDPKTGRQV